MNDLETRLAGALAARADLVQPEGLRDEPLPAPVVPLWRRTPVVLAAAACLAVIATSSAVLVTRDDPGRPQPTNPSPTVELPADVGRDWDRAKASTPAELDLDGDGTAEKVRFLREPSEEFDGRVRLQTTLSSTGEEAYGIADLGTTIGTSSLEPIDADGDGDQELVLLHELEPNVVGGLYAPVVFDLREGLLVQAVAEDPDLLARGNVAVPGSRTDHYELVRSHDFWNEDGSLFSSRSVDTFASGNMTLMRPEFYVVDVHAWSLDEGGILRAGSASCLVMSPEAQVPCGSGPDEGIVSYIDSVSTDTIGVGESAEFTDGYRFTARVEAFADPSLVVEGSDGRTLNYGLEVAAPLVSAVQPMSVFADGASFIVTSAADPTYLQVLVQDGDGLRSLVDTGEVALADEGTRTWQTANGALVSVTPEGDGSFTAWSWQMVSRTEMAALPWGTVCFDNVEDPSTARQC